VKATLIAPPISALATSASLTALLLNPQEHPTLICVIVRWVPSVYQEYVPVMHAILTAQEIHLLQLDATVPLAQSVPQLIVHQPIFVSPPACRLNQQALHMILDVIVRATLIVDPIIVQQLQCVKVPAFKRKPVEASLTHAIANKQLNAPPKLAPTISVYLIVLEMVLSARVAIVKLQLTVALATVPPLMYASLIVIRASHQVHPTMKTAIVKLIQIVTLTIAQPLMNVSHLAMLQHLLPVTTLMDVVSAKFGTVCSKISRT
jgi:hypothetical protein